MMVSVVQRLWLAAASEQAEEGRKGGERSEGKVGGIGRRESEGKVSRPCGDR